ncbi:MAG: HD domain-containing protein [Bacteroidales bacterium]|nr:HD domain-containing protein [Bacteroidales bacterium]
MANAPIDTELLDKAIIFAVKAHAGTERRSKGYPYIVHPLEALTIVTSLTNDQELLAAAVLHDVVEDTDCTVEQIHAEFGERVAAIVSSESDNTLSSVSKKDSWVDRKKAAAERLAKASKESKIVAMGDKLSNMRTIAADYDLIGDAVWDRFHAPGGKKDIAWRYRLVADALSELRGTPPYEEFVRLIDHVFGA